MARVQCNSISIKCAIKSELKWGTIHPLMCCSLPTILGISHWKKATCAVKCADIFRENRRACHFPAPLDVEKGEASQELAAHRWVA